MIKQKHKRMGKKGVFDLINAGMIAFITFTMVILLAVLLVSTTKTSSLVCSGVNVNGACYLCDDNGLRTVNVSTYNASSGFCTNATSAAVPVHEDPSAQYNATRDLQAASLLPPQFAQIIIIVIIVVGILGLLSVVGYGVYKRMN